jgi:retron-type reverse transcriptase
LGHTSMVGQQERSFVVHIRRGVLQGGILSPLIFNIFFDQGHQLCSQQAVCTRRGGRRNNKGVVECFGCRVEEIGWNDLKKGFIE